MIAITRPALGQIEDLIRFYVDVKRRPEAASRLLEDLAAARALIISDPSRGLRHPRPYPAMAALGFQWLLSRAYWIAWRVIDGRPVVTNVFHVSADIEGRAIPDIDDVMDW